MNFHPRNVSFPNSTEVSAGRVVRSISQFNCNCTNTVFMRLWRNIRETNWITNGKIITIRTELFKEGLSPKLGHWRNQCFSNWVSNSPPNWTRIFIYFSRIFIFYRNLWSFSQFYIFIFILYIFVLCVVLCAYSIPCRCSIVLYSRSSNCSLRNWLSCTYDLCFGVFVFKCAFDWSRAHCLPAFACRNFSDLKHELLRIHHAHSITNTIHT